MSIEQRKDALSFRPQDRTQDLKLLHGIVESTWPEDCGHVHEVRVAQHASQNRSVIEALCSKDVRDRNTSCAHRDGNLKPDPYLDEIFDAERLRVITYEERNQLEHRLRPMANGIDQRDRNAGKTAEIVRQRGGRFPLRTIQDLQHPDIEELRRVRSYLLQKIESQLQ